MTLQGANDLLDLVHDDWIWRQLLQGGLRPDAREILVSSLAAARGGYRCHREEHQRSYDADEGCNPTLDAALLSSQSACAALDRIVGIICMAGRERFRETTSLTQRFSIPDCSQDPSLAK